MPSDFFSDLLIFIFIIFSDFYRNSLPSGRRHFEGEDFCRQKQHFDNRFFFQVIFTGLAFFHEFIWTVSPETPDSKDLFQNLYYSGSCFVESL
jgi:hypothetical protein